MYIPGIETFLSVVRTGSLSRAAEDLLLAQTTVSQRLKILEQELGLTLVERHKGIKQIRLTPVGEEFFRLAEQWDSLWQQAKQLQAIGPKLSLSIGATDSINTLFLPPVYQAINQAYPPIGLQIRTSHSFELYDEVEKRQVDIAFVSRQLSKPNVIVEKTFSSPMVVLRKTIGEKQTSDYLHPTELDPALELFMPWGTRYQEWHDRWWNAAPPKLRMDSVSLLLKLLEPNQWTIMPKWVASAARKDASYCVYQLTEAPPLFRCYKLTHKYPTTLTAKALEVFDQLFAHSL